MKVKSEHPWLGRWANVGCLLILSCILIAARNLDPVFFPTLYAEDGKWTGEILTQGTLITAFQIREFPVFGLVGMQKIGLVLNHLFFSGDLTYLPLIFFALSTLFVAAIATLAFTTFSESMPFLGRVVLWAAVIFMPVGSDGNEIFGRILNLGFLFPVLQYLLLAKVIEGSRSPFLVVTTLFVSLIAGWTLPVSIGFSVIALVFLVAEWWKGGRRLDSNSFIAAIILLVVICNIAALSPAAFTSKGGADLPFSKGGFIEFSLARAWMYPLLAWFYSKLTDAVVLSAGLLTLTFAVTGTIYVAAKNSAAQRRILFLAGAFFTYYLATVVMRAGFTTFYGAYQTSFPDRYYYGLNIMAVFFWAILIVSIFKGTSKIGERVQKVFFSIVLISLLIMAPRQIEGRKPDMAWRSLGTIEYSICAHALQRGPLPFDPSSKMTEIAVYPHSPEYIWRIGLPVEMLDTFTEERCALVLSDARKAPR